MLLEESSQSNGFNNGVNGIKGDNHNYTMQAEAHSILADLLEDRRLNLPKAVIELNNTLVFDGEETQPFYPAPYKAAESQAAVLGLVGLLANAIYRERYGEEQELKIDV
jgi:hypothetical protein